MHIVCETVPDTAERVAFVELKILGHANIKMTERYAKLAKSHIARTGSTAREMWKLMEGVLRKQASGTI